MSDSKDDKSPQRRGKLTKTPSEDSNSSNKPMEVDPSDTPAADSSSKPEEKGASASQARDRLSIQPPDSYGGARPKVFPKKKEDGTKKSSDIPINSHLQRASEVLEATVCRRRELFRRRREDAKKVEEPVSRYLGPDWINAAAEERPPSVSPATRRLRALARNMQATEYEKRRREGKQDFKPWISTESGPSKTPAKQTLSNEPVECQFEDSFKAESDPDDPPRLQVKLPDLGKKSPEPSQKPKDKDEPVEEASPRVVHHDRYHAESISRFMFLDRAPFFRPEFDNDREPLHAYFYLDAIFAQHGIEDWRRFALAAYQAGRYHTEPELQTARAQMEELHVTEEEFLQLYHIVRRDYEQDEGCCDEFSDLVDRILTLLESIELMTSAMLYMDIWLNRTQKEEADQKEKVRRLLRATKDDQTVAHYLPSSEAGEGKQETDPSTSTESPANRSDSAIVEDCPSKNEEKTPPFFFETMREHVNLEMDYRPRHLTIETRPPSVLSSSDKSSTPTAPSPVDIASPSLEGTSSDNASPISEEAEVDAKMKVCVLVPREQVSVEGSIPSSEKPLKLSRDELTDTPPKSPLKVPRIAQLRETDSPDNTSENVSPIPADSPDVPELEEDSLQVNADRFHIVTHALVSKIMLSVINAAQEELIALSPGNVDVKSVAEQKDERAETPSTDSSGKRKGHQTDSDEESGKKMSKKRHME